METILSRPIKNDLRRRIADTFAPCLSLAKPEIASHPVPPKPRAEADASVSLHCVTPGQAGWKQAVANTTKTTCGGALRTISRLAALAASGFVTLRRDKRSPYKYTLSRRSLVRRRMHPSVFTALHPDKPLGNRQLPTRLLRIRKSDKKTFSKINFFC